MNSSSCHLSKLDLFDSPLARTFLHLDGIGEKKERALWKAGYSSWKDIIERKNFEFLNSTIRERLLDGVMHSYQAVLDGNWKFFNSKLPSLHKWRTFEMLAKEAVYLDIETDGGVYASSITVIGIYSGGTFTSFIKGKNIEDALALCKSAPLVITYSGTAFDIPLLKRLFPEAFSNAIHIDLALPLRRLGFKGGLKRIETLREIVRPAAVMGLTGMDAIKLWKAYASGDSYALELLLQYNRCDTVSLSKLMEFVAERCKREWLMS
jgi:uncharacterized protein YprB with RNaseH-like and TPR domain